MFWDVVSVCLCMETLVRSAIPSLQYKKSKEKKYLIRAIRATGEARATTRAAHPPAPSPRCPDVDHSRAPVMNTHTALNTSLPAIHPLSALETPPRLPRNK